MKSGAELRAADECNDSKGQMWDELTEGVEYAPRSAPPPPQPARVVSQHPDSRPALVQMSISRGRAIRPKSAAARSTRTARRVS